MMLDELSVHDIAYAFNRSAVEEEFLIWADLRDIDMYDVEHLYMPSDLFRKSMPELFRVNGSIDLHEAFIAKARNKMFVLPIEVNILSPYIRVSTVNMHENVIHAEAFAPGASLESKIFAFKFALRRLGEECNGYS